MSDIDDLRDYVKNMTPEQARALLRRVQDPPRRTLEGKEQEDVLLLLAMIEPFEQSNNQHSWTNSYRIGDTVYQVTDFPDGDTIVDQMLPEDHK